MHTSKYLSIHPSISFSLCLFVWLSYSLSLRIIMISNRQTSKDSDEIDDDNFDLTENTFPTIYSSFIITYSKNPF